MKEDVIPRLLGARLEDYLCIFPAADLRGDERRPARTGVEIDLVLELPGNRIWAVEIKRGLAPASGRGFRAALADVNPERAFLVHGGEDRYPKGEGVEAIGLRALAGELAG